MADYSIRDYTYLMEDRRKYVRFNLDQLVLEQFNRDTFIPAYGSDISGEGLGFTTSEVIEAHSEFFFMATLHSDEGDEIISGNGIALYCGDVEEGLQRVGLKFTDMSEAHRATLLRFIGQQE